MRPEELYYAILAGVEPEEISEWDPDEGSSEDNQRFILNSSKGLTEVTKSKVPTVQLIHESVRDFLLKDGGLQNIWQELKDNLHGDSHDRLKQCCLTHVNISVTTALSLPDPLPKANSKEVENLREVSKKKFPFLEYAVSHILFHADSAAGCGVSQLDFMEALP